MENLTFEGHGVQHVARGDEVLGRICTGQPDLLILDVMLPGLSGFDVCRQVRRTNKLLPILMLTARGDEIDKVMGLDLGADDYLTKPFSISELLARVRALVRRSDAVQDGQPANRLVFGDVSIDFTRFVAHRGGKPVHLTAKEFALLRCLAAERGAALKRDTLLERVWGEDVNVTNRTVDTHVLALRQKLETDSTRPRHLLTVHGVGYRFVQEGEQFPDNSTTPSP
jgi:DNA-binding response OmpR family regulator